MPCFARPRISRTSNSVVGMSGQDLLEFFPIPCPHHTPQNSQLVVAVEHIHGLDVDVVGADFHCTIHAYAHALDVELAAHFQYVHTLNAGWVARAYVHQQHITITEGGGHALAVGVDELQLSNIAGADVLVAGSAVFSGGSVSNPAPYGKNISALRAAAEAARVK